MENENNVGGAIGWFVCGTVIGLGAAMLIAPAAGKHTRKKLAQQAERGRKTLVDSSQEYFSRGRELFEKGRQLAEEAADMFERGRQVAEKTIDERI